MSGMIEETTKGPTMSAHVTLKDIAKETGYSTAAVSLVLNNRPSRLSDTGKKLIRETAERLHYVPNRLAQGLATSQTYAIALIVPDIENYYFASLAKRFEDHSSSEGYSLFIGNSNDSMEEEMLLIRRFVAHGIDGLCLIPSREACQTGKEELRQLLESIGIPFVLADRTLNGLEDRSVVFDNMLGASMAVEHLINHGHQRIGCVCPPDNLYRGHNSRYQGFLDCMKRHGLPVAPEWVIEGDYRFESGYHAADKLIDSGLTAVFCANDVMALGFLKRANELNVHVPGDMSLVGYDNSFARLSIGTNLTTVEQDVSDLAEQAWNRLWQDMRKPKDTSDSHGEIVLRPKLIVRSSVGNCSTD